MLDKATQERIVVDYKDIHKQALEDNFVSATELPYFEGDFWPNVIEDSIREINQEQQKIIQQEQQNQKLNETNLDGLLNSTNTDDELTGKLINKIIKLINLIKLINKLNNFKKLDNDKVIDKLTDGDKLNSKDKNNQVKTHKKSSSKKSSKKQNQRKNLNQRNKSGILTPQQWTQELTSKILATMDKHKEVFFVIRLHFPNSLAANKPVVDPDSLQNCDLMDGRDAFLTLAREKHYEFSSLRRAKFSTMALLYDLHNTGNFLIYYLINFQNSNLTLFLSLLIH